MSFCNKFKKHISKYFLALFILFSNLFIGNYCLADDDDEDIFNEIEQTQEIEQKKSNDSDPFEKSNRKVFDFNMKIYDNVLIPFNQWYEDKIPLAVRWTLKNYIQNYTETPNDIIYSVLDFDVEGILVSFWRFTINTLFGMFGGDDVASLSNLQPYRKSLGKVLYFYHIPKGPFLMLPFFGPSTIRETSASIISLLFTNYFFMHFLIGKTAIMFSWQYIIPFYPNGNQDVLRWLWLGWNLAYYIRYINGLGSDARFTKESALDYYLSFRDTYLKTLENDEKKYMKMRMEGTTTRTNVCDYEAMIELPEECEEDPKSYSLGIKPVEKVNFD